MKTQKAKTTFQQGDLVGRRLYSIPAGEQTVIGRKRLVLAHGESGHSHVIEDDDATLIKIGERIILKLTRNATIQHEEHHPITLEPGDWEIGRVTEYDWFEKMTRQVID